METPKVSAPKTEAPKTTFVEPKVDKLKPAPASAVDNIANWSIFPKEDDQIEARNNRSGRVFTGTVAEFNEIIRGA